MRGILLGITGLALFAMLVSAQTAEEIVAKYIKTIGGAEKIEAIAAQADEQRKKIVATKEGGAITGEERLREYLASLYGNVIFAVKQKFPPVQVISRIPLQTS